MADERGYELPLTQIDLAECLGLTSVHVNRTLKELREQGVMEFRSGRVDISDLRALEKIAEFDPTYLYLEQRPR
jgi:DNA-binding transcriptional regulator LsrR (DeoR family)